MSKLSIPFFLIAFILSNLNFIPLAAEQAKMPVAMTRQPSDSTTDAIFALLEDTLRMANEQKNSRMAVNVLNQMAKYHYQRQQFNLALVVSRNQYEHSLRLGDSLLIANALNNMGIQQHALGSLQQSVKSLYAGLKFAEATGDMVTRRKLYNNLASVFIDLKDKKNSLVYATKSYELAVGLRDSLQIAKSLSNLAISEVLAGLNTRAEKHLQEQARISKKKDWNDILSDSYNNLAELYVKGKRYNHALALYKEALGLNEQIADEDDIAYIHLGLANCYYQLKNFQQALNFFDRSVSSAERLLSKNDLKEVFLLGSGINEATGDPSKALLYRKRYERLNDSLVNVETQKYVRALELKYRSSQREKQLAKQQLELSKKDLYIMLALIGLILLSGGAVIAFLINKSASQAMKLVLLQAQIHPHFLFNTLNNLYALTMNKSEQAPSIVIGLSQILRYILYECNQGKIALARELEIVEKYIFLESTRYSHRLEINFNASGQGKHDKVEPLFLLPLVENAFKHGISAIEHGQGWINIDSEVKEDYFVFKISNNKPPADEPVQRAKGYGNIGLENIKKRLRLLYPKDHEFKIISEPEVFVVVLKIRL